MAKKNKTKNTKFNNVKDKLRFIQSECNEPELFEHLRQLFIAKGFTDVTITHGINEFGKDLVFAMDDPAFGERKWYSAVVKNKDASMNDFNNGGEIAKQIDMSFNVPHQLPDGQKISISGVFVIVNGAISFQASSIIESYLSKVLVKHVQIWPYQRLAEEIEKNSKESFLDELEPVLHVFTKNQESYLSDLSNTSRLLNLDINEIDDIFVNVETTYSRQLRQLNQYVTFDGDVTKKQNLEHLDAANEVLQSDKNFVIHGIPTSGKSLLLRRIGLKAIKSSNGKPNAVFFIELGRLGLKTVEEIKIDEWINNQYLQTSEGDHFEKDKFSKIYLLFDGLDEIKDDSLKKEILKATDEFIVSKSLDKLQVVVTMRTTEIVDNEELLKDFEKSELLPFNIGQALELVKKIIPGDNGKSRAFIGALKSSLLDSGLLRTPLALTLLAILYRDDEVDLNELPANITELYNKFVDTYLDRWDTTKGISQQYKYEHIKIILSFIGLHLQQNEQSEITTEELETYLEVLRKDFNYPILTDIPSFISFLKSKQGVFNHNDINDSFYFYNHFFQEYFVSLCLEDTHESILKDNFFSEWWENSIVFYCGKAPKRESFIGDVAKNIIPVDLKDRYNFLVLTSKCLQANHAISILKRIEIVEILIKSFDTFYRKFVEAGKEGKTFAASVTTMNLIIQFRDFFHKLFDSKFISDKDTMLRMGQIFFDDKDGLSDVTRYCISHFLSDKNNTPEELELFIQDESLNSIWSRIVFVDIDLLHYKKKVNPDVFKRVKRKMNKRKFEIQSNLTGVSTENLKID